MSSRKNDNFQLDSLWCRNSSHLLWRKPKVSSQTNRESLMVPLGQGRIRPEKALWLIPEQRAQWTDKDWNFFPSLKDTQTIARSRKAPSVGRGHQGEGQEPCAFPQPASPLSVLNFPFLNKLFRDYFKKSQLVKMQKATDPGITISSWYIYKITDT